MSVSNLVKILYLNSSFLKTLRSTSIVKESVSVNEDNANDALLQHELGKWLVSKINNSPSDISGRVRTKRFGKPFLPNAHSFNVSHTQNAIVCASTHNGEIGIDIEYKRTLDWQQYKDCFSTRDWEIIVSSGNPSFELLDRWTKKESLLKADGRGFQIPLSAVVLEDYYGRIEAESKKWYIRSIPLEGFFCHISTEFPAQNIALQEVQYFSH